MKPIDSFAARDLIVWLDGLRGDRAVVPASDRRRVGHEVASDRPYLRLQCDVDLSLPWAYRLAEVLAAADFHATFSILVGGPFYDVTSAHSLEGLDRIAERGHDFALHFDPRRYLHREPDMAPPDAIAAGIQTDVDLLNALGFEPAFCNPHRPMRLAFDYAMLDETATLPTPDLPGETYVSDSAKGIRDDTLAVLEDPPARLRLCLHPAWWVVEAPRKETIQARLNQIAAVLSAEATEWGNVDSHPGALEQDRRDARSANPARQARAAASAALPASERPAGRGRVIVPSAVETAAVGRGNGKRG